MNLADSSVWLEFFGQGPLANGFAPMLADRSRLVVPSIVVYEVHKRVKQQKGIEAAGQVVEVMRRGNLFILDDRLAVQASTISTTHKLAMADSIIYATARATSSELWTMDAHFEGLEGVAYFPKKADDNFR